MQLKKDKWSQNINQRIMWMNDWKSELMNEFVWCVNRYIVNVMFYNNVGKIFLSVMAGEMVS